MEQQANENTPLLLMQKPQELIRLFEALIDEKLKRSWLRKYPPPFKFIPAVKNRVTL